MRERGFLALGGQREQADDHLARLPFRKLRTQAFPRLLEGERVGNGHITLLVAHGLERLGYNCGEDPAAYDRLYLNRLAHESSD